MRRLLNCVNKEVFILRLVNVFEVVGYEFDLSYKSRELTEPNKPTDLKN